MAAVSVFHLFIVCLLYHQRVGIDAATLNNCGGADGDKYGEVVRGQASNVFTCSQLAGADITWTVRKPGTQDLTVGFCPNPTSNTDTCYFRGLSPWFNPLRTTSDSSTVTINPTLSGFYTSTVEQGELRCGELDSCPMDYITPASGTCTSDVIRTSSPWRVRVSCTFTQGNSSRNRYACRLLYRQQGTSSDTLLAGWEAMSPNTLPTGSAQCTTQGGLPGDGNYDYRVQVRPGRRDVTAGTLVFRRPSQTSSSCSPTGIVSENSTLTCACSTSDLGQPAGSLHWVRGTNNNYDVNNPLLTSTGGATQLVMTRKLSRGDDGSKYRCDVLWSSDRTVGQHVFTVQAGYPPSQVGLTLNSQANNNRVTVNEGNTVNFTCQATGGNPSPATITLSGPRATFTPSGPSPLTSDLDNVLCEDAGQFTCTAGNGYGRDVTSTVVVNVNCKPRGPLYHIGDVTAVNGSATVKTFDVTAYPGPLSIDFAYLGPSGDEPTSRPTAGGIVLSGACVPTSVVYRHQCTLTVTVSVSNFCSAAVEGFYQVNVTNSPGTGVFRFRLSYDDSAADNGAQCKCSDCSSYLAVAVALAVVLGLLVLTIVVVVVWLWRRGWVIPWAENGSTESKLVLEPELIEMPETASPVRVSGFPPQGESGPYDSLNTADIGVRSPYGEIRHHGNTEPEGVYEGVADYVNTKK